jgi:hypothetical protein
MSPFPILGIAFLLLAIFYFLFRRTPNKALEPDENGGPDDDMFIFDPDLEAVKFQASRKVTVNAPAQTINGTLRKLTVEANTLPKLPDLQVPAGKGIEKLLVLVIDDRIRTKDTREEVYQFDSPVTYTIEYTKEDAAATTKNADGTPRLSIVAGYQAADGWKFERLKTTVTPNPRTGGGTLTAKIKNLQPKDPKWIGIP